MTNTHRRFEAEAGDQYPPPELEENVPGDVQKLDFRYLILALLENESVPLSDLSDAQLAKLEALGKQASGELSRRSSDAWGRRQEQKKQDFISRIESAKLVPCVEGASLDRLQPHEVLVSVVRGDPLKERAGRGPFYDVTITFPAPPSNGHTSLEASQNNSICFDVSLAPGEEETLVSPPCTWEEMPRNLQEEICRQAGSLELAKKSRE